jgi:hypothetical protein
MNHQRNWISIGASGAICLLASSALAAERNPKIQQAIDRGVAFVRSQQAPTGVWPYNAMGSGVSGNAGATALVGLTLLECGVPADDPAVQQAAKFIRQNAASLDFTYALSTSIWFLDRLGDEADVPLIQLFAVRLMGGQNELGGWSYNCPVVGAGGAEERRLMKLLQPKPAAKPGEGKDEGAAKKDPAKADADKDKKRELPPEIKEMLKQLERRPPPAQANFGAEGVYLQDTRIAGQKGDNSNTQFASLALWVARRYGVPVEPALLNIEKRFRATQVQDGGWTYVPTPGGFYNRDVSPAMTCAGLIGLAVGHGAAAEAAKEQRGVKVINPDKDKNMQAGFIHLGAILQQYSQVRVMGDRLNDRGFYFLWSLERVGEIYGLSTIGRQDWYKWGSMVLLNSQHPDGAWRGQFHPSGVDTCFGLLFLVRANVAKDLSVTLKGKLKDPGTRTLKAGGVGGDGVGPKREKADKVAESSDKKSQKESEVPKLSDPKEKLGLPSSPVKTAKEPTENEEIQAAQKMSEELVAAPAQQQEELLGKYKEGKGASYTLALAGAIPRLSGESKTKVRDALAERFTRMTAATLRAELKDDDPEIRRAASLACAMKDDKSHVPDLFPLLDDSEPLVARAAHAALKSLTNQDFGPAKDASPKDRAQAIEAWKSWWAKQEKK